MTQSQALQILKTGANVFLTGQPGSGKTFTINQYVKYLTDHGIYPAITASTGIAATHIGGVTIHSWSGIGIAQEMTDDEIYQLIDKPWHREKFSPAKVLIIDEISMLDGKTLDLVDRVLRKAKNKDVPFGGLQVILVGDFFQLPPVSKSNSAMFVFESDAWRELTPKICVLHEQHRQEDMEFLEILTAMRNGVHTKSHVKRLKERIVPKEFAKVENHITRLFTHNGDVDALNSNELKKLPSELHSYGMEEEGVPAVVLMLKKNCLSPECLKLKEGALVMFTRNNFDAGYVNGTLGEVMGFDKLTGLPIVETKDKVRIIPGYEEWSVKKPNGKTNVAAIRQIPLRLAWAMTVHKAQGMSLDAASINLAQAFEFGQGYVALSRVRSLKGLYLEGLNDKALAMHPKVVERDADFLSDSDSLTKQMQAYSEDTLAKMEEDFLRSAR